MSKFSQVALATLVCGILAAGCAGGKAGATRPDAAKAVQTGQYAQALEPVEGQHKGIKYLLYIPEDYAKAKKPWPVVLFLHGAGERGEDLEKVKVHGPPKLAGQGKAMPFICVSPQCPEKSWWSGDDQVAALKALLDDVEARYRVDKDRVYVTGLSMGGFGTWALAIDQPKRFAAIAPICGKGDPAKVAVIKDVPAWVFHGAKDGAVPTKESEVMVDALKAAGGKPKFTVYPEAGHDSWTETYASDEFWTWLLAQRRK